MSKLIWPSLEVRYRDLDKVLTRQPKNLLYVIWGLETIDPFEPIEGLTRAPDLPEVASIVEKLENLDRWYCGQRSPILRWTYSFSEHRAIQECLKRERALLEEMRAKRRAA